MATKIPDAAVVEQAQDAVNAGDDLSKREQAALAAQRAVDLERGYEVIDWKGVKLFRTIYGGDTHHNESEIIKRVNEQRIAAADPFNQQG
jgi:hypothetical protein